MINGRATATIDAAGRVVIPKAAREAAGVRAGDSLRIEVVDGRIEVTPEPRAVKLVKRGRLVVAVPVEPSERLSTAQVRRTLDAIRSERGRRR